MLPNQLITSTSPVGGSPYQQVTRGHQAGSFAGAHGVTADTQGAAGGMDAMRAMQQGLDTAAHQQATAGLNFEAGPDEAQLRNAQKAAANQLVQGHKAALAERGLIAMPHTEYLGQLLG
jgi:hypothetical protein